ncbi:MAG TPA: hypothetical protein VJ044_14225 [Candidatus Hodarchaeales archaeon]|nr:hypothetical protein [Candidatus Hodarchaeales archaeon]
MKQNTPTRKGRGKIESIIKYAIYTGQTKQYVVTYRDFDEFKTGNLYEFLAASAPESGLTSGAIPWHRIIKITKDDYVLFIRSPR